jgi:transcriptional regulator with XRE-family HTH domain
MVHAGELVKEVVADRGIGISELARRLGVSRTTMYQIFERPSLDVALIHQLRRVLNYPFAELLGNQPTDFEYGTGYLSEAEFNNLRNLLRTQEEETRIWKDKYTALLEQMNRLLIDNGK